METVLTFGLVGVILENRFGALNLGLIGALGVNAEIQRRRTDRRPFGNYPLPDAFLRELSERAAEQGGLHLARSCVGRPPLRVASCVVRCPSSLRGRSWAATCAGADGRDALLWADALAGRPFVDEFGVARVGASSR